MKPGHPVVLVILDAFRADYLDPQDTPELFRLAAEGTHVRALATSPGFTQKTAIFTGAPPSETECFLMFHHDPEDAVFRDLGWRAPLWEGAEGLLRGLARRLDRLPGRLSRAGAIRARAAVAATLARYVRPGVTLATPGNIPRRLLGRFSTSEDKRGSTPDPGSLPVDSLFDRLRAAGFSYEYHAHPVACGPNEVVLAAARRALAAPPAEFYVFHFNQTDNEIHFTGTSRETRRAVLASVDRGAAELIQLFRARVPDATFLFLGDHGMTDVKVRIDLMRPLLGRLARAGLAAGREILYFLDSTLARFWFRNERARALVLEFLNEPPAAGHGRILSAEDLAAAGAPLDPRHGELIWAADLGVLISPCFFHVEETTAGGLLRRPIAMHGYFSDDPTTRGMAIVHGPGVPRRRVESATIYDAAPTLARLLGVESPARSRGRSWVDGP
ncbi:MAG: alkaline phosphatase family protein [Planctomycetes bacterium]|nr:alkaline phosphatase family protein [Planctomycetota bacterium]